jgi:glycosyltransferase involved in cell wall biosynthesis
MDFCELSKGHEIVMRGMKTLRSKFPGLVYDIVGGGEGEGALRELSEALGLNEIVHFHGEVDDDTLSRFYADASVFVMPSRSEGFGFVFLEAMAHGTPAIGGNRDATPEVILDGETGILVDPTNVTEVVGAIARLLEDSGLRERMGQAAARRSRELFGYDAFRSQLLQHMFETIHRT